MKKIGIIGGMSPESTIHYYERIYRQVNEREGGLTSPELGMESVNMAEIEKMMNDNEWDRIAFEMAVRAKILENGGAKYIAMASNTIHKVSDFVESQINIPIIHIADCVAKKCLSNGITNVGLIGTEITMTENFLKDKLYKNGLSVYTPNNLKDINEIDRIIFKELCKGKIEENSKRYIISVINNMIGKYNIDGIILGCTELEMLIKQEDLNIPIFDTTQSHIDSIVDYCLEKDYTLKKF